MIFKFLDSLPRYDLDILVKRGMFLMKFTNSFIFFLSCSWRALSKSFFERVNKWLRAMHFTVQSRGLPSIKASSPKLPPDVTLAQSMKPLSTIVLASTLLPSVSSLKGSVSSSSCSYSEELDKSSWLSSRLFLFSVRSIFVRKVVFLGNGDSGTTSLYVSS